MHCVAQDGRLPLHYAAKRGAPLEVVVVELLLGPESNGAATAATDKVRRSDHATTPGIPCPRSCILPLPTFVSSRS